jgi:hypothetical protein
MRGRFSKRLSKVANQLSAENQLSGGYLPSGVKYVLT